MPPNPEFPTNWLEYQRMFPNELACRQYLERVRWPGGFICPHCGSRGNQMARRLWRCGNPSCRRETSLLAGTIFHDTKLSLTHWFRAAWEMTSEKRGLSATTLSQQLGVKYHTAWTMLQKLRRCMVRQDREKIGGLRPLLDTKGKPVLDPTTKAPVMVPVTVEIDECWIGGILTGLQGSKQNKACVIVAAEYYQAPPPPKVRAGPREGQLRRQDYSTQIGRVRIGKIEARSAKPMIHWVLNNVEFGSELHTDAWGAFTQLARPMPRLGLQQAAYTHVQVSGAAMKAMGNQNITPMVHRVISLLKRWILGTHQGAWSRKHLEHYLQEFVFRFNRRRSRYRGLLFYRLLQQAVVTPPAPYHAITRGHAPNQVAAIWTGLEKAGTHPTLTGGWAVDACAGRLTRPHDDLDILISSTKLEDAVNYLAKHEYVPLGVQPDGVVRLENHAHRTIDLHPLHAAGQSQWEEEGPDSPPTSPFLYKTSDLTFKGFVGGVAVNCVAPTVQLRRRARVARERDQDRYDRRLLVSLTQSPDRSVPSDWGSVTPYQVQAQIEEIVEDLDEELEKLGQLETSKTIERQQRGSDIWDDYELVARAREKAAAKT